MPNDLNDLRVHFDDDTHEDRPATAGCILITPFGEPPPRPPNDPANFRCLSTERLPPFSSDPVDVRSDPPPEWLFCGRVICLLGQRRGWRVWVWRITGGTDENELLAGEWVACRVETAEEHVRRLSAELAEAHETHRVRKATLNVATALMRRAQTKALGFLWDPLDPTERHMPGETFSPTTFEVHVPPHGEASEDRAAADYCTMNAVATYADIQSQHHYRVVLPAGYDRNHVLADLADKKNVTVASHDTVGWMLRARKDLIDVCELLAGPIAEDTFGVVAGKILTARNAVSVALDVYPNLAPVDGFAEVQVCLDGMVRLLQRALVPREDVPGYFNHEDREKVLAEYDWQETYNRQSIVIDVEAVANELLVENAAIGLSRDFWRGIVCRVVDKTVRLRVFRY